MKTITTVMNAITAAFNLFVCLAIYERGVVDLMQYVTLLSLAALSGIWIFLQLRYNK